MSKFLMNSFVLWLIGLELGLAQCLGLDNVGFSVEIVFVNAFVLGATCVRSCRELLI